MLTKKKREEGTDRRLFLGGKVVRLFRRVQPLDIASAVELEEKLPVEADALEPVIIDLVSGQRLRKRRRMRYALPIRISSALLVFVLIIVGIVFWSAWQNKQAALSQLNVRVIFSAPQLGRLALSAWSDDAIEEEIYSGFGPPAYYGTACYAKSLEPGVCGDQHLAFVDNQGHLYTWNQNTRELTRELTVQPAFVGSPGLNWSWLYTGQYILAHAKTPSGGNTYQVWDAVRSRLLYTGNTPLLSLGSDGRWIAASVGQQKVQIIDGLFGEGVARTLSSPNFAHLVALSWSPDVTELATASADGTIQIWNAFQGTLLQTWSDLPGDPALDKHVNNLLLAWSPDGKELAVASAAAGTNMPVNIWNASDGQLELGYTGHSEPPTSLTWLDGGQEILSSNAHEALLWNSRTGQTLEQMGGGQAAAQAGYYLSQFLLNEPLLAVPDGANLQVMDMRTGKLLQTLPNEEGNYPFIAAAWNPGQQTYPVAVDKSGDLLIWQMHPWQVVAHYQLPCTFTNQTAELASLSWSLDGKELAVNCGNDGLIVLGISA